MSERSHSEARRADARLRRLVLLRAGATAPHLEGRVVGTLDEPLAPAGRAAVAERRRHWEWIDGAFASPLRRARESARILVGDARVTVLSELGPRRLGRWEGATPEEIRRRDPIDFESWQAGRPVVLPRGEALDTFRERVERAALALFRSGCISPLVVSHFDVIREIAAKLAGRSLPEGRPHPAEMVMLGRVHGGEFRLGRRSSDPEPLRGALERDGLSGREDVTEERHVAHLEARIPGAPSVAP